MTLHTKTFLKTSRLSCDRPHCFYLKAVYVCICGFLSEQCCHRSKLGMWTGRYPLSEGSLLRRAAYQTSKAPLMEGHEPVGTLQADLMPGMLRDARLAPAQLVCSNGQRAVGRAAGRA